MRDRKKKKKEMRSMETIKKEKKEPDGQKGLMEIHGVREEPRSSNK